jgi:hypothetical protein
LKAPGTKRLKLKYDKLLSFCFNVAFNSTCAATTWEETPEGKPLPEPMSSGTIDTTDCYDPMTNKFVECTGGGRAQQIFLATSSGAF